jgi:NADPH:quinone reductase-like Zn-dependent oxidoreductase
VAIDVQCCGINFADLVVRLGTYPDAPPIPCVIGFEVSGTVREVGDGVSRFQQGDRVLAATNYGGYTTVAVTPEHLVYQMPTQMSFEEAAAIPVQYATAYLALFVMAGLRSGERVLIHSAGGGVGLAAVQLAKTREAEIFGTASATKHAFLKEQGVAHLIDYRQVDYEAEISRLTDGRGVEVILNALGGKAVRKDQRILADLGRLVLYGVSSAVKGGRRSTISLLRTVLQMPKFKPFQLIGHNQGVYGLNLGRILGQRVLLEQMMTGILDLYHEGAAKPVIGRVFPFDQAPEAHQYLHDRRNTGKVLLGV